MIFYVSQMKGKDMGVKSYDELLAELKQGYSSEEVEAWKVATKQLLDKVTRDVAGIELTSDAVVNRLLEALFRESNAFGALTQYIAATAAEVAQDSILLGDGTIGKYPMGAYNISVSLKDEWIRVHYDRVPQTGNLRE